MNIPKEKIIDIRDLRIGNYLLYDGKIVHVTFLSMDIDDEYEESIGFCELGKTTNEKADWNRALCDKLDRIHISNEWLDRLGFEKTIGISDVSYAKDIIRVFNTEDVHIKIGYDNEYLLPTEYVHQLQNLYFALTGEELTIKELQP